MIKDSGTYTKGYVASDSRDLIGWVNQGRLGTAPGTDSPSILMGRMDECHILNCFGEVFFVKVGCSKRFEHTILQKGVILSNIRREM